ncbi:MAG TPA: type VI secretion system tube protein Hcp [Methylibium sp.]
MPVSIKEVTAGAGSALPADVDIYLDLTLKRAGKVKGESVSSGHKDDIVVQAFSWGVGAPTDIVTGQQKGRRSYRALSIRKGLDSASSALMSAVATNDEVKSAKLCLRKAGGEQQDYFTMTLEKARVVSVDLESDDRGHPVEKVSFNFQKISVEYRVQGAGGQLGAAHSFNDDLVA